MSCSGEGCFSIHIQNKKYNLCGDCVFKKSHGGKSRQEVYAERDRLKNSNRGFTIIKVITKIGVLQINRNNEAQIFIDPESEKNRINQDIAEQNEKEELQQAMVIGAGSGWVGGDPKPGMKLKSINLFSSKQKKKLKQQTVKQSEINTKYKMACIDYDHITEPVCTGCLRYQGGDIKLSHSHIISQKDCKNTGREDLISTHDNIRFHCLDFGENEGCHRKWENPKRRAELADYQKNMEYIKSISLELYNRYLVK